MSETPKLWAPDGTARLLATADELGATVNDGPVNGPDIPQFLEQVGLRPATPDEVRAAVVPLLDLEPAVELVRELIDRIPPVLDFPRNATTWTLGIVCAALGLGEDTEGGET